VKVFPQPKISWSMFGLKGELETMLPMSVTSSNGSHLLTVEHIVSYSSSPEDHSGNIGCEVNDRMNRVVSLEVYVENSAAKETIVSITKEYFSPAIISILLLFILFSICVIICTIFKIRKARSFKAVNMEQNNDSLKDSELGQRLVISTGTKIEMFEELQEQNSDDSLQSAPSSECSESINDVKDKNVSSELSVSSNT